MTQIPLPPLRIDGRNGLYRRGYLTVTSWGKRVVVKLYTTDTKKFPDLEADFDSNQLIGLATDLLGALARPEVQEA